MDEPSPKPFPELETPRLLLREIGASDAPALFAIHGDAQLMRWFGFDPEMHPDNAASIRLALRLGFVFEGRLRQAGYWGGRHHDLLRYSLLRCDWKPPDAAAPGDTQ